MAAQAALKYANNYDYGAAAPAYGPAAPERPGHYDEPRLTPSAIPVAQPRPRVKPEERHKYGVSLFAIAGFVCAGVLMVFVMLALINLNELSSESVQLQKRLTALTEQERRLEIEYEQTFDLKAVERYAMDVLGMTKPESEQISVLETAPTDKTEIIDGDSGGGALQGLGSFLSSLLEYFK